MCFVQTEQDIILRDELEQLRDANQAQFRLWYTVETPPERKFCAFRLRFLLNHSIPSCLLICSFIDPNFYNFPVEINFDLADNTCKCPTYLTNVLNQDARASAK